MPTGSRHRGSDLFPVSALSAHALARPLAALGQALRHERSPALRARLRHRARPGDELAVGIPVAGVEGLPALATPFHELAAAARLGARDTQGDGLGGLALGIPRAGDELAEAAMLDHHGLAARRAGLIGHLVGGLLAAT